MVLPERKSSHVAYYTYNKNRRTGGTSGTIDQCRSGPPVRLRPLVVYSAANSAAASRAVVRFKRYKSRASADSFTLINGAGFRPREDAFQQKVGGKLSWIMVSRKRNGMGKRKE